MADTTVTHHPDPIPNVQDQPVWAVSMFVGDHTRINVTDRGVLNLGAVTNGHALLMTEAEPMVSFDILDRFLARCSTAVAEARQARQIAEAAKLPCGGGCKMATWPAGAWVCGGHTLDTDRRQRLCSLPEGHDGDHITCGADTHAVHRWARSTEGGAAA